MTHLSGGYISSAVDPKHQWMLRFDRVVCRECGVPRDGARKPCRGSKIIRPMAAMRQEQRQRGERDGTSK